MLFRSRTHTMSGLLFLTLQVSHASAKEPLWSEMERAARSDAVLIGMVTKLERIRKFGEQTDLWRATVNSEQLIKGHELTDRKSLLIYFERPRDGVGGRCPSYVELKHEQRACFYARSRSIDGKQALFLGMGSDVHEARPCAKCNHQLHRVPIVVGQPNQELAKRMADRTRKGSVIYLGCRSLPGNPNVAHVCIKCKQWKADGAEEWEELPSEFGSKWRK